MADERALLRQFRPWGGGSEGAATIPVLPGGRLVPLGVIWRSHPRVWGHRVLALLVVAAATLLTWCLFDVTPTPHEERVSAMGHHTRSALVSDGVAAEGLCDRLAAAKPDESFCWDVTRNSFPGLRAEQGKAVQAWFGHWEDPASPWRQLRTWGEWPTEPGQVCLSDAQPGAPSTISEAGVVYSVVCGFTPPGGGAQTVVLVGARTAHAVESAVATWRGGDDTTAAATLQGNAIITAESLESRPRLPLPWALSLAVMVGLLVVGVAVLAGSLDHQATAGARAVLGRLGVSRRLLDTSMLWWGTATMLAAASVGAVLGVGVWWAARPSLGVLAGRTLAGFPDGAGLVTALILVVTALTWQLAWRRPAALPSLGRHRTPLLASAVVALLVGVVVVGASLRLPARTHFLMTLGAVGMCAALTSALVLDLLASRSADAGRGLGRAAVGFGSLPYVLAAVMSMQVLGTTGQQTWESTLHAAGERHTVARVRPGDALLTSMSGDASATVPWVEAELGAGALPANATTFVAFGEGRRASVLVLRDATAVARWLRRPLAPVESSRLDAGGCLGSADFVTGDSVRASAGKGARVLAVPATRIDLPKEYSLAYACVATEALPRSQDVVAQPTAWYFVDLTPEQEKRARDLAPRVTSGGGSLETHAPTAALAPSARDLLLSGAVGVSAALLGGFATWSLLRAARQTLAVLASLGIPRRLRVRTAMKPVWHWFASTAVATTAGLVVLLWLVFYSRGVSPVLPWFSLASTVAGLLLGQVIATIRGLAALDPNERLETR